MMNIKINRLALLASILAFVVIVLGAYTRLSDAGLGCPDWPGCYGQVSVPSTTEALQKANTAFPGQKVEPKKAWAEMVHRYVAGTLVLLILAISFTLVREFKNRIFAKVDAALLIGLVVFQAALGMWTVTLKLLPIVVMGHLLGGLTLLSLLWCLALRFGDYFSYDNLFKSLRPLALFALIILFLQISLGGWTSSNYAALACPDFPYCHGTLWPQMNFREGFNFFSPIGLNFQGGLLNQSARTAIHMAHRFGALLASFMLAWLSIRLIFEAKVKYQQILGGLIAALLILQISLGILNVVWQLPLSIAVIHNAVAAMLLIAVITVNFGLYPNPIENKAGA